MARSSGDTLQALLCFFSVPLTPQPKPSTQKHPQVWNLLKFVAAHLHNRTMTSKWRTFKTRSLEEDAVVFLWDILYQVGGVGGGCGDVQGGGGGGGV